MKAFLRENAFGLVLLAMWSFMLQVAFETDDAFRAAVAGFFIGVDLHMLVMWFRRRALLADIAELRTLLEGIRR